MIESKTRFPGAPLIADRGLELPPEAAKDLREFVQGPESIGAQEPEGGVQETGSQGDVGCRGGGSLSKGAPRPTSEPPRRFPPVLDSPDVHHVATLMMPLETADEALDVYFRYVLNGYERSYAFQRAFIYAAEAEGYHRGPR